MLQRGAHWGDPLQFIETQVQLHQPSNVKGVGRDTLICQLVVGHPDILQLGEMAQEVLWERINGVGLHVELVQLFREGLRDLRQRTTTSQEGWTSSIHPTRHLQTDFHTYFCQLVAANVQQCEGLQRCQGCAHIFHSVVMDIQDREVNHPLQVRRCYLINSINHF